MDSQNEKDGAGMVEKQGISAADLQRSLNDFLDYYVGRRTAPLIDQSMGEALMEGEKFDRVVTMLVGFYLEESERDNAVYGRGRPDFMRDHLKEMLQKYGGDPKGILQLDNVEMVLYMAACKKMAELYKSLSREHKKLKDLIEEIRQKLGVK